MTFFCVECKRKNKNKNNSLNKLTSTDIQHFIKSRVSSIGLWVRQLAAGAVQASLCWAMELVLHLASAFWPGKAKERAEGRWLYGKAGTSWFGFIGTNWNFYLSGCMFDFFWFGLFSSFPFQTQKHNTQEFCSLIQKCRDLTTDRSVTAVSDIQEDSNTRILRKPRAWPCQNCWHEPFRACLPVLPGQQCGKLQCCHG